MPVIGFISGRSPDDSTRWHTAFHNGLSEAGAVEGQNVTVEYHWLDGQYDQLPSLMADLVRRRVAVIATPGSAPASLAAKAATKTIPIAFSGRRSGQARPGSEPCAAGHFFSAEVVSKQLSLLHELVPTPRPPCETFAKPRPPSGCGFR
jgi:putative ABC transport system substrate-binding protein